MLRLEGLLVGEGSASSLAEHSPGARERSSTMGVWRARGWAAGGRAGLDSSCWMRGRVFVCDVGGRSEAMLVMKMGKEERAMAE